jgi:hypothetical protein
MFVTRKLNHFSSNKGGRRAYTAEEEIRDVHKMARSTNP